MFFLGYCLVFSYTFQCCSYIWHLLFSLGMSIVNLPGSLLRLAWKIEIKIVNLRSNWYLYMLLKLWRMYTWQNCEIWTLFGNWEYCTRTVCYKSELWTLLFENIWIGTCEYEIIEFECWLWSYQTSRSSLSEQMNQPMWKLWIQESKCESVRQSLQNSF